MSSAAIEPFCHGVEGQIFIYLCRRGLHPTYELELFQSRVQRAQHQLQRWEKEPNFSNTMTRGPSSKLLRRRGRCWALLIPRPAARHPFVWEMRPQRLLSPARRRLPGNTAASFTPASSSPRRGCIPHCCCYWEGENMILEEGGHEWRRFIYPLAPRLLQISWLVLVDTLQGKFRNLSSIISQQMGLLWKEKDSRCSLSLQKS